MKRTILLFFGAIAGCPDAPTSPPPAHAQPDTSWIKSDKLDADVQELVLRAYDVDLAFPFHVRARADDGGVAETVERVRPADVAALVRDERIMAVRCAPPPTAQVDDETWRAKVDVDVRAVYAARSACWTPVTMRFDREPSDDEWRAAEEAGVVVHARDAQTALVWAPVRAIPRLAALAFVAKIEPYTSPAE